MHMKDIELEEGRSATFKVKIDFGYPKARVLFYKNNILLLNDARNETCNYSIIFLIFK